MSSEVPIPEEAVEAAALPLAQYMARSDTYDAASDAVRAAAPLIIAAYLDGIGREFWRDSHISKVCRERASVLRGEGAT